MVIYRGYEIRVLEDGIDKGTRYLYSTSRQASFSARVTLLSSQILDQARINASYDFHNYFVEQKFSLIFTILRDLIVITTVMSCYKM